MYRIQLTVENPLTGESQFLKFRLDPSKFDETLWADTYAPIKAAVDALVALDATPDAQRGLPLGTATSALATPSA